MAQAVKKNTELIKTERTGDIYKDCFTALSLALLGEFFMSSITKGLIFSNMLNKLEEMGYTKDEINVIREKLIKVIEKFGTKNSFMG